MSDINSESMNSLPTLTLSIMKTWVVTDDGDLVHICHDPVSGKDYWVEEYPVTSPVGEDVIVKLPPQGQV